jgi:hypothetical protein
MTGATAPLAGAEPGAAVLPASAAVGVTAPATGVRALVAVDRVGCPPLCAGVAALLAEPAGTAASAVGAEVFVAADTT